MQTHAQAHNQKEKEKTSNPLISIFVRLFWMFFGVGLLFIVAAVSLTTTNYSPKILSIVYWFIVISLIAVRFIDIRFFNGQTIEGEPATLAHWKKYSIVLFGVSSATWIVILFISGAFAFS